MKHFKRSIPKGRMPNECGKCGAEAFGDTNQALPAVFHWSLNFPHLPHSRGWQGFYYYYYLFLFFIFCLCLGQGWDRINSETQRNL